MAHSRLVVLSAGVLSLALLHCAGPNQQGTTKTMYTRAGAFPPTASAAQVKTKPAATTASAGKASSTMTPASGKGTQAASRKMGDEEIAGVTDALNGAFIDQARVALGRATDPQVKGFAQEIFYERSDMVREQSQWETERKLVAARSPLAEDIAARGAQGNARLLALGADEFGRAYLDQQIRAHEEAISLVEGMLLPRAKSSELRLMLGVYRTELSSDLERARSLRVLLDY